jgi:peptide chain release factor subunit 1
MSTKEALLDKPTQPALDSPEGLMQRLLEFEKAAVPVVSIYLDARADQHGRDNFLPWVHKQLTERGRTFEAHTPARASFEEDFVRIMRFLEDGVNPAAQGLAIFACSGASDYFEIGQFAAPFERNRLFVFDRPHLYPLARLIDEYRRYVVVLADTNRARISVFAGGRAVDQKGIANVKTKHAKVGGWSQARYQRHEENYHLHHAKEVIDTLARIVRSEGIENIILAGDEETVIPLLRGQMPKELSDKVIDVLSLGIDTPEHELLSESLDAFKRHDTLSDQEKVQRLLNEYRADDLGIAGVPETLAALSNGQVEEMLITRTVSNLEYDEAEVKKVLAAYTVDGVVPVEIDSRVVADELIRRAEQLSSARVTFIEDESLLEPIGGVGAFLRYRITADNAVPYEQGGVVSPAEALVKPSK